ncbi:MAG: SDR family NAD(P)-dependent oxidoreductase [Gammaproteobacteria bacterium]|nr:SDR family NAD(P)-dependent oxidoreductase [Gammaproteobacteria bacterium]
MKDFKDKIAVVTGGGTGMGRGLVLQLVQEGCHVATCDVLMDNLDETLRLAKEANPDITVTGHTCDVGIEDDIKRFAQEVREQHDTEHINLLFNNAGIGGGGGFVEGPRDQWERTFAVCWYGVYWSAREFMPMLVASDEGHIINTSSVNGFWASIGPGISHTAYSAAKFAVKGFSESLITDLRLNAPHVKVSVVMPGHIGTSIAINSARILGNAIEPNLSDADLEQLKQAWIDRGLPVHNYTPDQIRERLREQRTQFRDNAPTTADQAATIILNGVRNERWRILVGDDAHRLDELVREAPEEAYDVEFFERRRPLGSLANEEE